MSNPLSEIDPDLQKALDGAEVAFTKGLVDEYLDFYADNALLLIHNQAAIQVAFGLSKDRPIEDPYRLGVDRDRSIVLIVRTSTWRPERS